MPRPTRRRFFLAPGAGLMSFSSIALFLDLHQVAHPVDHSAHRGRVDHLHGVAAVPEPQALHRLAVLVLGGRDPFHQGHLDLLAGRGRLRLLGHLGRPQAISSTFLPRLAAISEGRRCWVRPSSVARTTLYGLVEPWHLAEMLVTPITSNTARMAPPALMPLPSMAGFIITRVAPCWPRTSWWIVPLFSGIFTMLRRACSIAFCTATGTSRALPLPMPIEPSPSPTTVSAAKPRIRPPFTTLVTRFTEIIFSRRPSLRSSWPWFLWSFLAMSRP